MHKISPFYSSGFQTGILFTLFVVLTACDSNPGGESAPVKLVPCGQVTSELIPEPSGIVKSQKYSGLYWVHNDKGNKARLFAITAKGELIKPAGVLGYDGIQIKNADNVDWEDITCDDQGFLYLADMGNKNSDRRDLAIYKVAEPDPQSETSVKFEAKYPVYYPDQKAFPPASGNYNCESMFWSEGNLFVLTKHETDANTRLYRLDSLRTDKPNGLTYIGTYPAGGKVTGADCSQDGKKLAVITYNEVRIYQTESTGKNWFEGNVNKLVLFTMKYEGICFSGSDTLIITNEERFIYKLPVSSLKP